MPGRWRRRWAWWKHRLKRLAPNQHACQDLAVTSLKALRDSADAFPPLKSAASGVLVLWEISGRVKGLKKEAQTLSRRALETLEALADAVPDPTNITPETLKSIQRFNDLLKEVRDTMEPLTKQKWHSTLLFLNHNEDVLVTFNRRLDDMFQEFMIASATRTEVGLAQMKSQLKENNMTLVAVKDDLQVVVAQMKGQLEENNTTLVAVKADLRVVIFLTGGLF